jgi:mercuric ion transport protein
MVRCPIRFDSVPSRRKSNLNTVDKSSVSASLLSYFSLFTSVGTLLCCALPSLLVLAGLGASVASALTSLPWLVTLSKHKGWTFAVSGVLIALSSLNMYYLAPCLKTNACAPDNPSSCVQADRFSKVLLWVSVAIYLVGFFSAYLLGPILTKLDK